MNFIKAAAIAISAVIACGAAEAKMPKEVKIVYVKAPFNLQIRSSLKRRSRRMA